MKTGLANLDRQAYKKNTTKSNSNKHVLSINIAICQDDCFIILGDYTK